MSIGSPPATARRTGLIWALVGVTVAPAFLSTVHFEVTSQSVASLAYAFALLAILSGAHVWITLAYYADPHWVRIFLSRPVVFVVVPSAILVGVAATMALSSKEVGLSVLYATTFVNL